MHLFMSMGCFKSEKLSTNKYRHVTFYNLIKLDGDKFGWHVYFLNKSKLKFVKPVWKILYNDTSFIDSVFAYKKRKLYKKSV